MGTLIKMPQIRTFRGTLNSAPAQSAPKYIPCTSDWRGRPEGLGFGSVVVDWWYVGGNKRRGSALFISRRDLLRARSVACEVETAWWAGGLDIGLHAVSHAQLAVTVTVSI
jgi:hypothetical protein